MGHDRGSPILIYGHGRTGTTLLADLLGHHPDLGWFSQYANARPRWPQLAALSRVRDVPALDRRLRQSRLRPVPQESVQLWQSCFPGFFENQGDWGAAEAEADGAERLRTLVRTTLRWQGKDRFVTKYTGLPRYEFMRAVLPGVTIVHVSRDPRHVVMSIVKQRWGYKTRPEDWAALGRRGQIDHALGRYLRWWEAFSAQARPAELDVRFEDLVADPVGVLDRLAADLGLRASDRLLADVAAEEVVDPGDGWRSGLSDDDLMHLERALAEPMRTQA